MPKKKKITEEHVKVPETCNDCNGTGLLDENHLCFTCKGGGLLIDDNVNG